MKIMNDQKLYYSSLRGRLIGSKAREQLILEEIATLSKKDFFVDIGCAQGHYLQKAKKFTPHVFGLEYSAEKIEQIKNKEQLHIVNANAEKIPFGEKSFDFVLCSEVLEHVPNWKKALRELKRIARKKILVTIPLEKSLFWKNFSKFAPMETRGHLHSLESKDIEKQMNGFELEKKVLVHTPSRHLNKLLKNRLSEKKAMYSVMLFKKKRIINKKKQKGCKENNLRTINKKK
jgi:ubiquinone/menaquinone biosynthesis C-methylase UbiE